MKRLFLTILCGILFANLAEATQNSMTNLSSTQNNRSISNQISISDLDEQTLKELEKYDRNNL